MTDDKLACYDCDVEIEGAEDCDHRTIVDGNGNPVLDGDGEEQTEVYAVTCSDDRDLSTDQLQCIDCQIEGAETCDSIPTDDNDPNYPDGRFVFVDTCEVPRNISSDALHCLDCAQIEGATLCKY